MPSQSFFYRDPWIDNSLSPIWALPHSLSPCSTPPPPLPTPTTYVTPHPVTLILSLHASLHIPLLPGTPASLMSARHPPVASSSFFCHYYPCFAAHLHLSLNMLPLILHNLRLLFNDILSDCLCIPLKLPFWTPAKSLYSMLARTGLDGTQPLLRWWTTWAFFIIYAMNSVMVSILIPLVGPLSLLLCKRNCWLANLRNLIHGGKMMGLFTISFVHVLVLDLGLSFLLSTTSMGLQCLLRVMSSMLYMRCMVGVTIVLLGS